MPAGGNEAFLRLAEYMAGGRDYSDMAAGVSSAEIDLGLLRSKVDRSPTWLARAMLNSGAADLLRPYRRVK